MKPEFYDFIELFENNIFVKYIASELDCWNTKTETKDEAIKRMIRKNYDILGINENGEVIEYITKNRVIKKIKEEEVISDNTPINELILLFIERESRRFFISKEDNIKWIVTTADLQKGPSLLLIFGIIANFEILCNYLIKNHYNSNWEKILSKRRQKFINRRFNKYKKQDDDLDKLSCSDLGDKMKLILKTEVFNRILEKISLSKTKAKDLFKKLKKLRNNIAHARYIKSGFIDWKEIIELIKKIELFSIKINSFLENNNHKIF